MSGYYRERALSITDCHGRIIAFLYYLPSNVSSIPIGIIHIFNAILLLKWFHVGFVAFKSFAKIIYN